MSEARNWILLVEDNPDDERLSLRGLRRFETTVTVVVARDGEEAIATLSEAGSDGLPRFVLLDLKLPKRNGYEVLEALRAMPLGALVPIVVFSSSAEPGEVHRCYLAGANSYLQKPLAFEHYVRTVELASIYWTEVNSLSSSISPRRATEARLGQPGEG